MKLLLILATTVSLASAANIAVFNTGLDSGGNLGAAGTPDAHYTLTFSLDPTWTGPTAYVSDPTVYPISTGDWVSDTAVSQWISPGPDPGFGYVANLYIYTQTFDLTGFDPSTAVVSGNWAADDLATVAPSEIYLNGSPTGNVLDPSHQGFDVFTPFSITSGFTAGVNTLEFHVWNGDGPTGLHVQISGTAATPEPSTGLLLLGALGVLPIVLRRRTSGRIGSCGVSSER